MIPAIHILLLKEHTSRRKRKARKSLEWILGNLVSSGGHPDTTKNMSLFENNNLVL
jgi:hypothetical protein